MASVLDRNELNVENFEGAIAVGMKPRDLLVMFNKTGKEMDEWCVETYGRGFSLVFDIVKQCCYKEFLDTVRSLGYRGNPSALNIINQAIADKEANNVVKIVFDSSVPTENEEDKNDEN